MQTLSFQQNNRAPSEHLKFQYQHSEAEGQPVDHRAICSAVRAWAAWRSLWRLKRLPNRPSLTALT